MKKILPVLLMFLLVTFSFTSFAQGQENIADALEALKAVDVNGQGHDRAIEAMQVLNGLDADQVPELLIGMDGANMLARNWIRGAIQTSQQNGGQLPFDRIRSYFEDSSHSQMGRLLAFNMLKENDASIEDKIVPTLVDDPCLQLRRMAVDSYIQSATKAEGPQSIGALGFALDKARDIDQVSTIVSLLKERGVQIDTQKQLGFIGEWNIVGPFDNTDEKGFETPYGPELTLDNIDVDANYEDGKEGEAIGWSKHATIDSSGSLDLNSALDNHKFATAYAYAEFESAEPQVVDVRIGCINANKVWVNGELIISNEVYHVGMQPDQFTATGVKLKEGVNTILYKVCQNDQKQPWAQDWSFQLRVCDDSGKAIAPSKKKDESEE